MKTLSEKAMLASLNISCWDRYKFDAKVSNEVAAQHNTTNKAGRYNKNLLAFNPDSYKAVTGLAGEARQTHYKHTLPWSDEGSRILPCANWQKYTDTMRTLQTKFNIAAQEFVIDAPALFARSLRELNGLGNAADFPTMQKLSGSFDFRIKFSPFPTADDFRVTLQPTDMAAIRSELETNVNAAVAEAMKEPFKRLYEVVRKMAETLGNSDAIFRDTLVTNVEELLEVLPKLNLTDDVELTGMCQLIQQSLVVDPDTLRQNKYIRSDTATRAKTIMDNLASFMA